MHLGSRHKLKSKHVEIKSVKYTICRMIAEGGYSTIYEVEGGGGQSRRFALKRMRMVDVNEIQNCKKEISLMRSYCQHENLLKLYSSQIYYETVKSSTIFVVDMILELCTESLYDIVSRQKARAFPTGFTLKALHDVCLGLQVLHTAAPEPIIHRDIKLENILRKPNKNFVLCDFGSCTTAVLDPTKCSHQAFLEEIEKMTTLPYRAPEMVNTIGGHSVTTKADIWALGCVLYFMCYFRFPFDDSLIKIQEGHVVFAGASGSEPPKNETMVQNLILFALCKDPEERPDIAKLAEAIDDLLHSKTSSSLLRQMSLTESAATARNSARAGPIFRQMSVNEKSASRSSTTTNAFGASCGTNTGDSGGRMSATAVLTSPDPFVVSPRSRPVVVRGGDSPSSGSPSPTHKRNMSSGQLDSMVAKMAVSNEGAINVSAVSGGGGGGRGASSIPRGPTVFRKNLQRRKTETDTIFEMNDEYDPFQMLSPQMGKGCAPAEAAKNDPFMMDEKNDEMKIGYFVKKEHGNKNN